MRQQSAYNIVNVLSLSTDMITIFHARAGYKFRFVTVEIAGTLIKLPVEGESGKVEGSGSGSFRLLAAGRDGGLGGQGLG